MIIKYKNIPCLVVKKLENMGPEPHYECLFKNNKIILAPQPSGDLVECQISFDFPHYFLYLKNGIAHREVGPAEYDETTPLYRYCKNGQLHRLDGPAQIYKGHRSYYINGNPVPSYLEPLKTDESKEIKFISYAIGISTFLAFVFLLEVCYFLFF